MVSIEYLYKVQMAHMVNSDLRAFKGKYDQIRINELNIDIYRGKSR